MSINISKRRSISLVPEVNMFNNWLSNHQQGRTSVYTSTKTKRQKLSSTFHRSTVPVNPQFLMLRQSEGEQKRHRRTYSSYRNAQSQLSVMRDDLLEMSRQLNYLMQKAKKSRVDIKMTKKELFIHMEHQQQKIKQTVSSLNKLVKSLIQSHQSQSQQLKFDLTQLKDNYKLLKQKTDLIESRLSAVQSQCGFLNFKSNLIN